MPGIKPGSYDPMKPDIELFDFKSKKRYGLKLDGPTALQVGTISQDDSVFIRATGKRVGDFDEQRSWKGGRGVEKFNDNASGYWDSQDAWTLSDGHLHQGLLWRPAQGLRSAKFFLPDKTHSMAWRSLMGTTRALTSAFTADATFTSSYVRMWIRKVGNPGDLTMRFYGNSAGNPTSVGNSATISADDVTDVVSLFMDFPLTEILPTTLYHVGLLGDSGDNSANHWEVGGYEGGTSGRQSSTGGIGTWSASSFDLYYFIGDSFSSRYFLSFFLDEAMYIVDKKDAGTAPNLYINGDRGKATAGTGTTISDSGKAWASDKWAGAFVKIIRGTGVGQVREIASNTATALTVTSAWTINPSTDSEYIIYATQYFTEITGHGLTYVTSTPIVVNQIVYFPQGSAVNIRRMIWNSTTAAYVFSDDGTNKADFLVQLQAPQGLKIAKALKISSVVNIADAQAYGNPPTDLTFGANKVFGSTTSYITGMNVKEAYLYVFKTDGAFMADSLLNTNTLQSGLEKTPSPHNGAASIVHQQFVMYSWMHSIIRIYGSSHDDIGQDWSGKGLPDGREGVVSSFDSYTSLLIAAIDAGSGTSSVLGFDGIGFHEIFRAYDSNQRIRLVKVQPCEGTRNRMWIDCGGDLVFQEMPFMKGSPRLDSGVRYMHEAVLESAAIDMGTASDLPKFIKELTVFCENLGGGNEIVVDYQTDENVGTSNWTEATTLYESPESKAYLGLDNIRKFAYRLRIRSADNTAPVDVLGAVPSGYARVPFKMVWTMRCRADNITSRGRIVKPDELMRWLLDTARFPSRIQMTSQYQLAHKFFVVIHPPRMFPYKPSSSGQSEESMFTITLEEA